MGDTNIEWATKVWNPTRGCRRVSPGCEHCYAERQAIRHSGPAGPYEGLVALGKHGPRWTGEARLIPGKLDEPLRWRRRDGGRERVFVDSMSDLFYEGFSNEEIAAVFGVMAASPQNDFLVLTKRPERARDWFSFKWWPDQSGAAWTQAEVCRSYAIDSGGFCSADGSFPPGPARALLGYDRRWPLPNVWLGVSVEDQQRAEERVPVLLGLPAAIRFISAEPLLGPIDLRDMGPPGMDALPAINWVIVGGESGPGARPMDLGWARALVQQCEDAGAACFVKQLGARPCGDWGPGQPPTYHLTDITVNPPRESVELARTKGRGVWKLADKKGGNPAAWPEDLRVRQFPNARLTAGCKEEPAGTERSAIVPNPAHGTEI